MSDEEPDLDPLRVAQRLARLPERPMREAVLSDLLENAAPLASAWLLDGLAVSGRAGGPPFDVSLLAAVDLLGSERLSYETRRRIFEAAAEHGLAAARELLFSVELDTDREEDEPRAVAPGARPLTLGERKSLARRCPRHMLERLLADPNIDVVRELLGNPKLTQDDVLKVATSRRSVGAVLHLVLAHPRWGVRPEVRRALIRNPNMPQATALRLVGLLSTPDLRDIRRDPHLPDGLAAAVERRLRLGRQADA